MNPYKKCGCSALVFVSTVPKALCVADACSLLFAAQIELEGKTILDWLLDRNNLYVHPEVKLECFTQLQTERVSLLDPDYFKRQIKSMEFNNQDVTDCLNYLDNYCKEKSISNFSKLGVGERYCTALSLYLSVNQRKPVILLTDDYEAEQTIEEITQKLKFAITKAIPDIIIHLFQTTSDLSENQIYGVLQDYYSIRPRPILVKSIYDDRMKFNCRNYWLMNCGFKCC